MTAFRAGDVVRFQDRFTYDQTEKPVSIPVRAGETRFYADSSWTVPKGMLTIGDSSGPHITIDGDGRVELWHCESDEAALVFWKAVNAVRPSFDAETLARALFDWEYSDEATEKGEAWAGPDVNGVRMCRDDFDARMMKALDVMWRLREADANRCRAKAKGMLRMMKLRGGT